MSKNPVVHMEVAFETDPLTRPGDEDWTEVTSEELPETERVCVNALRTSRGARIRTGEIVPGRSQASVQFPNRVFEPLVSSSPWYPNVDLRKRVRYVVERPAYPLVIEDGGAPDELALPIGDGGGPGVDPEDISDGGSPSSPVPQDATEAVIWTGFIESLPTSWRKKVAGSTVSAVGLLGIVNNIQLPPSVLQHTVLTELDLVQSYWPMTESTGTFADDIKGTNDGTYLTPVTTTGQLVPFDRRPCVQIVATSPFDPAGQSMTAPIVGNGDDGMAFGCWFKWDRGIPRERMIVLYISHPTPSTTGVAIQIDPELDSGEPTGKAWVRLLIQVGGEGHIFVESADLYDLFTAEPHFVGCALSKLAFSEDIIFPGPPGIELFIDGDGAAYYSDRSNIGTMTEDSLGVALDGMTQIFAGLRSSDGTLDQTDAPVATVGHVFFAYTPTGASFSFFEDFRTAGMNPWADDTTGERLERILDIAGVDAADRDIATGVEVCGPALLLGETVGSYVKKIAATEQAPLFESADGKITFGDKIPNDPDIAFTLSDRPVEDDGTPYEPVDVDYSTARMINTVEVTRVGGNPQTVTSVSTTTRGPAPLRIDTLHESPDDARAAGEGIVARNSTPRKSFDGVTVASRFAGEVPAAVSLESEIGDAVQFYGRPDDDPDGDPLEAVSVVESIEQKLDGSGSWKTSFGVYQHLVLPCFALDDPDAGLGVSVICEGA